MGDVEFGKCEVCGVDSNLTRTYFRYDIKCECHSPQHFEVVRHCSSCTPEEPKTTNVELRTSTLTKLVLDDETEVEEPIIVPKTLEEAFEELKKGHGIENFKSDSESKLALYHHTIGRYLRNEWGLWSHTNDLCKWFLSIGIKHADDRSSIILTSFHRHLNNHPIDLKGQVIRYWKHWYNEGTSGDMLPPNIPETSEEYRNHYELYKEYFNE